MSIYVDVVVILEDGREWHLPNSRPLRRLPSGACGVVYHGEVYPFHEDGYISLEDEPYDIDDCPVILDWNVDEAFEGEESPTEEIPWHLESNRFGRYLVFDGSEEVATAVLESLEKRGLKWVKWDRSLREADDGYFYDWYVKLAPEVVGDGLKERLEETMERLSVDPAEEEDGAAEEEPQRAIADGRGVLEEEMAGVLVERVRFIEGRFNEQEGERELLRQKSLAMAETNRNLSQTNYALARDIQGLHQQLEWALRDRSRVVALYEKSSAALESIGRRRPDDHRLRELLETLPSAAVERAKAEKVERELDAQRREKDAAEQLMNEELRARQDAEEVAFEQLAVIEQLEGERNELRNEIRALKRKQRPSSLRALRKLLRALFERLQFDEESLLVMGERFDKLAGLIAILDDINKEGTRFGRKGVRAKKGWWEVDKKISTGRKEAARVYYRQAPESDQGQLLVWVRMKATQREDIAKME